MKRNYVFSLLVGLLLIFTLTACGEKMPTECPSYIDLSLDWEIEMLNRAFPVPAEMIPFDSFVPEGMYKLHTITNARRDEWNIIYMSPENVLYHVDYRMREVDGVIYKYVTKNAVREGDRYIYKVDNWSGEGLMVAEYNDNYYKHFNDYYKSQGMELKGEAKSYSKMYPLLPPYIDLSGKRQLEQLDRVIEMTFTDDEESCKLAQQFVPEGATVYRATENEYRKRIIYITADGVYYDEQYYFESDKYRKCVTVYGRKISDNYMYSNVFAPDGEILINHYFKYDEDSASIVIFDRYREAQGLSPVPLPSQLSWIYWNTDPIVYDDN